MEVPIRLHILALPHTVTNDDFSHCAYTGKDLRYPEMMMSRGFEVYHYGVEGSTTGATRDIQLMTRDEWLTRIPGRCPKIDQPHTMTRRSRRCVPSSEGCGWVCY